MAENAVLGYFQDKSRIMGTALTLLLLSFFFINWGLRNVAWAYWLGLVTLAIGMILPPLSRFTARAKEEDEADQREEQGD